MAKCDLEIALDRADRSYTVGETVSGFVGVEVNADCRCDGLTVTFTWETHGSGNRASGAEDVSVVFEGEWKAGEKHVHPFEFRIPRGPVSYHGHYLNVDWVVRARADIPWALDPKAEAQVLVAPDGGPDRYDLGPRVLTGAAQELGGLFARGLQTVVAFGFGGTGLVIFGVVLFGLLPEVLADGLDAEALFVCPFLAFPLVFVGIAAWMLFTTWRNAIAERRLGEVVLAVAGDGFRAGDAVPVTLRLCPSTDLDVTAIRATLRAQEVVVRGSGTKKKTYRHVVFEQPVELASARKLPRGQQVDLSSELTLPTTAAPSFGAVDNALQWAVEVHVDIPGWPDWRREVGFSVQP